ATRIFNRFPNDGEVEQFLVKAAKTESNQSRRDGLLHMLGKRKSNAVVVMVRGELKANNPERLFSKSRMYLALGDVGSQDAYNVLVTQLPRERDRTSHSQILMAIGVTKNPAAKDLLIGELKKPWQVNTWAAVEGLRFLGDPSVTPILEAELNRDVPAPSYKETVRRAISKINTGDDKPFW
ncbi:MAG: HEAT repeat domain-containing protein, partial [Elusimicrobiota bacterium]